MPGAVDREVLCQYRCILRLEDAARHYSPLLLRGSSQLAAASGNMHLTGHGLRLLSRLLLLNAKDMQRKRYARRRPGMVARAQTFAERQGYRRGEGSPRQKHMRHPGVSRVARLLQMRQLRLLCPDGR